MPEYVFDVTATMIYSAKIHVQADSFGVAQSLAIYIAENDLSVGDYEEVGFEVTDIELINSNRNLES